MVACGSSRKNVIQPPSYTGEKLVDIKENIIQTSTNVQKNINEAKESNQIVSTEVQKAEFEISTIADIPASIRESVNTAKTHSEKIGSNLNSIDTEVKEIAKTAEKLTAVNTNVEKLEKTIKVLQEENNSIKQDAVKKLYSYLGVIFFAGTVVVLAGVALSFFYSRKVGITIAGMGMIALCLAAGATFYLKYLAILGAGVVALTVIGTIIYLVITTVNESNKKNDLEKTTEENVELLEVVKQELSPDKKIEIFGDRARPGIAHSIQTEKTKKKVQEIREKTLKKKIAPTIPTISKI